MEENKMKKYKLAGISDRKFENFMQDTTRKLYDLSTHQLGVFMVITHDRYNDIQKMHLEA